MREMRYEVVVGNLGTVYDGTSGFEAIQKYWSYVGESRSGRGRAAGEGVVLLRDGRVFQEHFGTRKEG